MYKCFWNVFWNIPALIGLKNFGALLSFTMISMEVQPGLRFLLESSNVFKTLETISNKCVECPLGIPLGTFVHI